MYTKTIFHYVKSIWFPLINDKSYVQSYWSSKDIWQQRITPDDRHLDKMHNELLLFFPIPSQLVDVRKLIHLGTKLCVFCDVVLFLMIALQKNSFELEWKWRSKWTGMSLVFCSCFTRNDVLTRVFLLSHVLIWSWFSELIEEIGCHAAWGTLLEELIYMSEVCPCIQAWCGGIMVLLKSCFSIPCFLDRTFAGAG